MVDKLLVLQECDIKIRSMEKELKDIPERQEQERTRLIEHKKALADAEERLKTKQSEIKQFELENEVRREKISKFRQQQLEIKTNQEFKAIEVEIKNVESAITGAEDIELNLMENFDEIRHDVEARRDALEKENVSVEEDIRLLNERAQNIKIELDNVRAERNGKLSGIDTDWLRQYERVISHKDVALVQLVDGICSGCHMKLPPSVVHDVKKQSQIVSCDYCGRLLY